MPSARKAGSPKYYNVGDTCIPVFTAAQFITSKSWKQPVYPDEWIKKMCFSYAVNYYSATKKDKRCIFRKINGLKVIISNETNQTHMLQYRIVSLPPKDESETQERTDTEK